MAISSQGKTRFYIMPSLSTRSWNPCLTEGSHGLPHMAITMSIQPFTRSTFHGREQVWCSGSQMSFIVERSRWEWHWVHHDNIHQQRSFFRPNRNILERLRVVGNLWKRVFSVIREVAYIWISSVPCAVQISKSVEISLAAEDAVLAASHNKWGRSANAFYLPIGKSAK
jgi:hypothetical protein